MRYRDHELTADDDRALTCKLLRDLLRIRGQALAIALVVASGVAVLVMSMGTIESLRLSQVTYYERYRFADVFAQPRRAPDSLAARDPRTSRA